MIALIVAYSKNKVIGKNNKMPWHLPNELKHFKEITMGGAVVMGRKTFESIGEPLEGRLNIIISTSKKYSADNLITVGSLNEAFERAKGKDIYISGGAMVYKEALPYCEKLFVTEIDAHIEGDTFFPEFDESLYEKEVGDYYNDEQFPYRFIVYTKKL